MVVRTFARSAAPEDISLSSATRALTADMISPPLSPTFNFDSETVPSIVPALEYISSKLQQKMLHVTLVVGRGMPFPTTKNSDLMVIPITSLDEQASRCLRRALAKASMKFRLGQSWSRALERSQHERKANEYLIQQSILQNEVMFSQEGLTLLSMDRIYIFKRRLCALANGRDDKLKEAYIESCVHLLHRTILDFQGRPFSKAFFHRVYEQLSVRDELLTKVANAYRASYQQDGIVLPPPSRRQKTEYSRRSPIRDPRPRRQACSPSRQDGPLRRGPKTPQSSSDVTPITKNEWKLLIGPDFHVGTPMVTKWTPSPVVFAMA